MSALLVPSFQPLKNLGPATNHMPSVTNQMIQNPDLPNAEFCNHSPDYLGLKCMIVPSLFSLMHVGNCLLKPLPWHLFIELNKSLKFAHLALLSLLKLKVIYTTWKEISGDRCMSISLFTYNPNCTIAEGTEFMHASAHEDPSQEYSQP